MWRSLPLACAALLALTASSARAARPTLTAAAYRAQATSICRALNSSPVPSTGTDADKFAAILSSARTALARLRALRPPSSLGHLDSQVIATIVNFTQFFGSLVARVRAGTLTPTRLEALISGYPVAPEVRLWRELGVPVCAET